MTSGMHLVFSKGCRSRMERTKNHLSMIGRYRAGVKLAQEDSNKDLIKAIEDVVGISPVKRVGAKGYAGFYRMGDDLDLNKKVFYENEKIVLEVLGNKHKITIPPSYHRTTKKQYKLAQQVLFMLNIAIYTHKKRL